MSPQALAVVDGLVCRIPYTPGLLAGTPEKPRLIMVEGVSRQQPLVSFYGAQVGALSKQRDKDSGALFLDAPSSRYLFKLDSERLRLIVAVKTEDNDGGRNPAAGEGVAGNCSPL